MKTFINIGLSLLLAAMSSAIYAADQGDLPEAPADSQITTLTGVDTESDSAMSVVSVKLNLKPKWRKLDTEDHGSFVQILLPGTVIPKPGTFYDGSGPIIKKVAVFQVSPSDGAIRLFTSKEAAAIKAATSAEVLGDRVIITIDHKKVADLPPQAAAPQISAVDPDMLPAFDKIKVPTADQVVASTPIRTDIPPPAQQIKESPGQLITGTTIQENNKDNDNSSPIASAVNKPGVDSPAAPLTMGLPVEKSPASLAIGQNVPDLGGKLSGIAVFSAIMLILLGALYFLKPILRRRSMTSADGELIKMKTLATMPLAAKQRLALVQVAGQQILLAISPDNVNFITTIAPASPQHSPNGDARSRTALAPAAMRDQFSVQLLNAENDGTVEMRKAQTVQRAALPRASGKPMANPAQKPAAEQNVNIIPARQQQARKSINIAIGDDGIKRVGASQKATQKPAVNTQFSRTGNAETSSEKPLEDITRLIREKLKNLPAI